MFDDLCVTNNYTILEVMQSFEENIERVAIVRNDDKQVIGVISQGDIIKSIVRGVDVHSQIRNILKPSFMYLKEKDIRRGFEIVKSKGVTLIPILDDGYQLIGVIKLSELLQMLEFKKECD